MTKAAGKNWLGSSLRTLLWLAAIVPLAIFACHTHRERRSLAQELEGLEDLRFASAQAQSSELRAYRVLVDRQEQAIARYRLRLFQP